MDNLSVFHNNDYGHHHSATLIAETVAGGKSAITPEMRVALDVIAADPDSILFGMDIDKLVKNRYVNMFERDAHGLPYLEDYVIKAALRNASKFQVPTVRCYAPNDDTFSMATEDYVNNEIFVLPLKIHLRSADTSDPYKYGRMVAIDFFDSDGVKHTRFVEVLDNVKMNIDINAMMENDRWHMLWRSAMSYGIGAARHHGYGKFVVSDWT